ncbi:winged helix-turn-helix transcriptional regulator [Kribbella sp. NPDC056345]|uniref:winged helix-turn-helix transcriptional regulator n=1 Tax=Kribbella sp. NPDC056345 TaxID=3345789 RepID=UPI0035E12086
MTGSSREWTVFSVQCPSRASLARIANKWTAMIVVLLHEEPRRFGELHRQVEGITKKVLIDTLRALERDGMVERIQQDHAYYQLTPLGRTLHAPLQALQVWAESYVDDVQAAQDRYDAAADDRILSQRPDA